MPIRKSNSSLRDQSSKAGEELALERKCSQAFQQLKPNYFLLGDSVDLEVVSGATIHRFIRDSFSTQKHRLKYNAVDNNENKYYYSVIVFLGNLNPGKPNSFIADFQNLINEPLVDFSVGGEASTLGGTSSGMPCLFVFNYNRNV